MRAHGCGMHVCNSIVEMYIYLLQLTIVIVKPVFIYIKYV